MMYKSLHNLVAPQYLTRKFKYVSDIHNCNTRQAAAGQLALPPLTMVMILNVLRILLVIVELNYGIVLILP